MVIIRKLLAYFYLISDILMLECKVKWALGSITSNKASGGDGIPAELFQILKDDAVKVLHSIWQQIWKTQQWLQEWKRSVSIPIPKIGNAKECSNYCTIALTSHSSKVMLKILQVRLQHYVNCELPEKEKREKADLKRNIQKTEIMAFIPITSWQILWETMERVRDYFGGLLNHCRW